MIKFLEEVSIRIRWDKLFVSSAYFTTIFIGESVRKSLSITAYNIGPIPEPWTTSSAVAQRYLHNTPMTPAVLMCSHCRLHCFILIHFCVVLRKSVWIWTLQCRRRQTSEESEVWWGLRTVREEWVCKPTRAAKNSVFNFFTFFYFCLVF